MTPEERKQFAEEMTERLRLYAAVIRDPVFGRYEANDPWIKKMAWCAGRGNDWRCFVDAVKHRSEELQEQCLKLGFKIVEGK